ncbi:MAG: hypothetical protein PHT07_15445 [Paludibacter sp.]|nr:hypothetical protein [Paludibacter sp.]
MIPAFDGGGALKLSPDVQLIAEQNQEYKRIGYMSLKRGHTLFSVNTETFEILPVKIVKQVAVDLDGQLVKIQKTNYDPRLFYTSALTKETALKHYRKRLNEYFAKLSHNGSHNFRSVRKK